MFILAYHSHRTDSDYSRNDPYPAHSSLLLRIPEPTDLVCDWHKAAQRLLVCRWRQVGQFSLQHATPHARVQS
jgi:hypothetical protein